MPPPDITDRDIVATIAAGYAAAGLYFAWHADPLAIGCGILAALNAGVALRMRGRS